MRTLCVFLLIDFYGCLASLGQYSPLNSWSVGGYSRFHADLFSPGSNLAVLAEVPDAGLAIAGQRQPGLPELDVY